MNNVKVKLVIAIALIGIALSACDDASGRHYSEVPVTHINGMHIKGDRSDVRVKVEMIEKVIDPIAYDGERGVYIITDTKTGTEYIGVSGIGISEIGSHANGKSRRTDER